MLCELNWHGGQTHDEQAATWPGEGHGERVKNPRLVRKTYLGSDQHLNEKQKRNKENCTIKDTMLKENLPRHKPLLLKTTTTTPLLNL